MNNLCATNITTRWRGLYGIAVLLLWLAGCDSQSEDFNSFQINDPNLKMELVLMANLMLIFLH